MLVAAATRRANIVRIDKRTKAGRGAQRRVQKRALLDYLVREAVSNLSDRELDRLVPPGECGLTADEMLAVVGGVGIPANRMPPAALEFSPPACIVAKIKAHLLANITDGDLTVEDVEAWAVGCLATGGCNGRKAG